MHPLNWARRVHPQPSHALIRIQAVVHSVMSSQDLVSLILCGTVGPSAFVAASGVCKLWHRVCRTDALVLKLVALYQGGVTRSVFCGLFALTAREAQHPRFQHTRHTRRWRGGVYYLYGLAAVDAVLALGMPELQERIAARSASIRSRVDWAKVSLSVRLEERLHATQGPASSF